MIKALKRLLPGRSELSSDDKIISLPTSGLGLGGLGGFSLGAGGVIKPFVNGSSERALQANISWAWKCQERISMDAAGVPLRLGLERRRDPRPRPVIQHPFLDLMERPNPVMSSHEFWELIESSLLLHGSALAWKNRLAPNLPPSELWFIPWHLCRWDNEAQAFHWGPSQTLLPVQDLLWFRQRSIQEPILGQGTIQACAHAADENFFIKQSRLGYYKHGTLRGPTIEADAGAGDDEIDAYYEDWMTYNTSTTRQHYPQVLPRGWKIQEAPTVGGADVDFIKGAEAARDEILAIFGVPASILGIVKDVNRANAEANMAAYQKGTLEPRLLRRCRTLETQLLSEWDSGNGKWRCFFDDFIIKDADRLREDMKAQIGNGVATPNEWRVKLGEREYPDEAADLLYLPSGLVPLITPEEPPEEPEPAPVETEIEREKLENTENEAETGENNEERALIDGSISWKFQRLLKGEEPEVPFEGPESSPEPISADERALALDLTLKGLRAHHERWAGKYAGWSVAKIQHDLKAILKMFDSEARSVIRDSVAHEEPLEVLEAAIVKLYSPQEVSK